MLCVREAICFVCRWSGSAIYLPTLEGLVRLACADLFFRSFEARGLWLVR